MRGVPRWRLGVQRAGARCQAGQGVADLGARGHEPQGAYHDVGVRSRSLRELEKAREGRRRGPARPVDRLGEGVDDLLARPAGVDGQGGEHCRGQSRISDGQPHRQRGVGEVIRELVEADIGDALRRGPVGDQGANVPLIGAMTGDASE